MARLVSVLVLALVAGSCSTPSISPQSTSTATPRPTTDVLAGAPGEFFAVTVLHDSTPGLGIRVEIISTNGNRRTIASFRGVRPSGWEDASALYDSPTTIGPNGLLVLEVERDGGVAGKDQRTLILDLRDPAAAPVEVDGVVNRPVWGPDGSLADLSGNAPSLIDVATGRQSPISVPASVSLYEMWLADGSGWLAFQFDPPGGETIGAVTRAGAFHSGLAAEALGSGRDRVLGAAGGTLTQAMSDGATSSEYAIVEVRAGLGGPCGCQSWASSVSPGDDPGIDGYAWDAARTGLWVLRSEINGPGRWLSHVTTPGIDSKAVDLPAGTSWRIEALSPDDSWILLRPSEGAGILIVDTLAKTTGRIPAELGEENYGPVFAGWVR